MNLNTEKLIIIILGLLLALTIYFAFKIKKTPYDEELIEKREKQLEQQNAQLERDIALERKKTAKFQKEIDSLEHLKNKIEIRYVTKSNEIDNSSVSTTINDLDRIFAKNGIR